MVREVIGECYVQSLQMNEIETADTQQVKHFVRETLDCACPNEVFEHILIDNHSDIFTITNTIYRIGGRLFVAVLVPADWRDAAKCLGQLIDAGMQYRDQHGFNRFRLVIATREDDAINKLQSAFSSLPHKDEKVHLHVIPAESLPFDAPA